MSSQDSSPEVPRSSQQRPGAPRRNLQSAKQKFAPRQLPPTDAEAPLTVEPYAFGSAKRFNVSPVVVLTYYKQSL